MDSFVSKLHSKATGAPANEQPAFHTFSIQPSSTDPNLVIIHHANYPPDGPPLFSIKLSDGMSMSQKPDIQLFQSGRQIGDATTSLMSSRITMSLRGQQMETKQSSTSGSFRLDCPPMQDFKWKVNQLTGSSLELCDPFGQRLARIKKSGLLGSDGGQKLEIFNPCDNYFVDMAVLSGYAAWVLNNGQGGNAGGGR